MHTGHYFQESAFVVRVEDGIRSEVEVEGSLAIGIFEITMVSG